MKYLSIDLKTTGFNTKTCQILQVAAVIEDTDCPLIPVEQLDYFCCFVDHDQIIGEPYALQMNDWILRILSGVDKKTHPIYSNEKKAYFIDCYIDCFEHWLKELTNERLKKPRITVAGKNVAGFDMQFLPKNITKYFDFRVFDIGSLCVDWNKQYLPGLPSLKNEFNVAGDVTHDALEDARDIIRVIRAATNNYTKSIRG